MLLMLSAAAELLHYVCAPVAPPAVLTAIASGQRITDVRRILDVASSTMVVPLLLVRRYFALRDPAPRPVPC